MEKELIGKKIIRAKIRKLKKSDSEFFDSYTEEEVVGWDDKPILELEMEDGTIFLIDAGFGGGSNDEYPRFISIKKTNPKGSQ